MDHLELQRFRSALTHTAPPLQPEEKAARLDLLDEIVLASDGYIPFRDNIDQAARHGVRYIADPGGSAEVEAACEEHGIILTTTGSDSSSTDGPRRALKGPPRVVEPADAA